MDFFVFFSGAPTSQSESDRHVRDGGEAGRRLLTPEPLFLPATQQNVLLFPDKYRHLSPLIKPITIGVGRMNAKMRSSISVVFSVFFGLTGPDMFLREVWACAQKLRQIVSRPF